MLNINTLKSNVKTSLATAVLGFMTINGAIVLTLASGAMLVPSIANATNKYGLEDGYYPKVCKATAWNVEDGVKYKYTYTIKYQAQSGGYQCDEVYIFGTYSDSGLIPMKYAESKTKQCQKLSSRCDLEYSVIGTLEDGTLAAPLARAKVTRTEQD